MPPGEPMGRGEGGAPPSVTTCARSPSASRPSAGATRSACCPSSGCISCGPRRRWRGRKGFPLCSRARSRRTRSCTGRPPAASSRSACRICGTASPAPGARPRPFAAHCRSSSSGCSFSWPSLCPLCHLPSSLTLALSRSESGHRTAAALSAAALSDSSSPPPKMALSPCESSLVILSQSARRT